MSGDHRLPPESIKLVLVERKFAGIVVNDVPMYQDKQGEHYINPGVSDALDELRQAAKKFRRVAKAYLKEEKE